MSKAKGIYDVTESGIKFRDWVREGPDDTPKDGPDFVAKFKENFTINILEHPNPNELVFEMIGCDVSLANALRRIMIAEVPTMAIEHVYMWSNSSIMHDEVLAHRLGLVPLKVDPRLFEPFEYEGGPTDKNTLVFRLSVTCTKPKDSRRSPRKQHGGSAQESKIPDDNDTGNRDRDRVVISNTPDLSVGNIDVVDQAAEDAASNYHGNIAAVETPGRPYTKHVYSSDLEWVPQGDQVERLASELDKSGNLRPVHEDILLAKLRPGQAIELEAHARLGDGKDHAKYSPVATACYRLMPVVELLEDVYDELADELVNLYEPGVFDLVSCDDGIHKQKAVVVNPYACTMSRNFMKNDELKRSVKISRKADHFIFSIESVGMLPAATIFAESLKVLKDKCHNVIRLADEAMENELLK